MKLHRISLIGLTLLPLLTGCQGMYGGVDRGLAEASKPLRQCLSAPLDQTRILDDKTLFASDRSGNAALIKMTGACMRKNEAVKIVYRGSTEICGPVDVEISGYSDPVMQMPCFIGSVTPLTRAEAKSYENGKAS